MPVGSECMVVPAEPPRPALLIEHSTVEEIPAGTKVRVVADPSPTDPNPGDPLRDPHPEKRQVTVYVLEGPLGGHSGMTTRHHLQSAPR